MPPPDSEIATRKLQGGCLCQCVRYSIQGALSQAVLCHCQICRKAQGSAFSARGNVPAAAFRWVRGEHLVRYYESSDGHYRGFCVECGSPLIMRKRDRPHTFGLALGSLDSDPGVRLEAHVYVMSKAPWYEVMDPLPQFKEHFRSTVLPSPSAAKVLPDSEQSLPDGFRRVDPGSPYRDLTGPFYVKKTDTQLVMAVRLGPNHVNARGIGHGGLLMTLADMALGYSIHHRATDNSQLLTASLTTEFLGAARVGDWVEVHTEVLRIGKRMAFANAFLMAGERKIMRASGVFSVSRNPRPS